MNYKMSESIKEIATALVALQSELTPVKKDITAEGTKFNYNYADLPSVMEIAKPLLTKNKLALTQLVGETESGTSLTTLLMHTSGEYISSTMPLLIANATPQGQGSAITYARRYAFMAIIGMVAQDEDDDGAEGSKEPATKTYTRNNYVSPSAPTMVVGNMEETQCKNCGGTHTTIALTKADNPRNPSRPYWKCLDCPPDKSFSSWVKGVKTAAELPQSEPDYSESPFSS